MLESEIFGHERGAFTGAHAKKPGLLEIANNGTLFLDEVGELPQQLQVKFLRVIETRRFFRVGAVKETRVDVKFISATNKDIKAEVEKGGFRADLYYRIGALTLFIPPLRERKEDIPLLIEHFRKQNPDFRQKQFSQGALKILCRYPWPGNVRELQNMVHRILLLSKEDLIEEYDLPPDLVKPGKEHGRSLADVEKEHILRVLKETGGQRAKAAEALGIDPKTLYRKLHEYGEKE
jgi:transcriptional regulator with PAS, ATPase and Fis domain